VTDYRCVSENFTACAMILMIMAIDEIFDPLIETFLDFSFELFSGTGIDRVRNQKTFVGYVKYGGMKVVLKSIGVTGKFGD